MIASVDTTSHSTVSSILEDNELKAHLQADKVSKHAVSLFDCLLTFISLLLCFP